MKPKRFSDALKIALALPVYQIGNLVAYANTPKVGRLIGTAVAFLPIILSTADGRDGFGLRYGYGIARLWSFDTIPGSIRTQRS
jgi:hypothetical protein